MEFAGVSLATTRFAHQTPSSRGREASRPVVGWGAHLRLHAIRRRVHQPLIRSNGGNGLRP